MLVAARQGHSDLAALFLDHGEMQNERDGMGRTGLHWAALLASESLAYTFLLQDTDTLIRDYKGDIALSLAIRLGARGVPVAKQLLEAEEPGGQVDFANRQGDTPLHEAVKARCPQAIVLLLHHRADRQARNAQRLTPRDIALQNNDTECLNALNQIERG